MLLTQDIHPTGCTVWGCGVEALDFGVLGLGTYGWYSPFEALEIVVFPGAHLLLHRDFLA